MRINLNGTRSVKARIKGFRKIAKTAASQGKINLARNAIYQKLKAEEELEDLQTLSRQSAPLKYSGAAR